MASFLRFAGRSSVPAVAALMAQKQYLTSCDVERKFVGDEGKELTSRKIAVKQVQKQPLTSSALPVKNPPKAKVSETSESKENSPVEGFLPDEEGEFHGLFPKRQLWQPKIVYPLWDDDWDGKKLPSTGDKEADRERTRHIRKTGVTRHIILIRHGQYDETHKEDSKRTLTELGRQQAELTGKRLAEMVRGINEDGVPCNIKVVRVSDLARAKETADIIASYLPDVERSEPDPLLNEGRPAHHIPGGRATASVVRKLDEQHPRVEEAFQKLFYRAPTPKEEEEVTGEEELLGNGEEDNAEEDITNGGDTPEAIQPKHEFEIVICHANVIRYFLCRALQLPPEAWLRWCTFNCSLTYVTIRPTGTVSCRMLGDIGHLPYEMSTFSGHHGYNW